MATKRAESRARYFVRKTLQSKGWNINHPEEGGDLLEEQEVVSYFPKIGLGQKRPDFLVCLNGEPAIVIETKNEFKKYDKKRELVLCIYLGATVFFNALLYVCCPQLFYNIEIMTMRFHIYFIGVYLGKKVYEKTKITDFQLFFFNCVILNM